MVSPIVSSVERELLWNQQLLLICTLFCTWGSNKKSLFFAICPSSFEETKRIPFVPSTPRIGCCEIPRTFGWGNPGWINRHSWNFATFLGEWVSIKEVKVKGIKLWNSNTSKHKRWGTFSRTRNTLLSISHVWTSTKFGWASQRGNSL